MDRYWLPSRVVEALVYNGNLPEMQEWTGGWVHWCHQHERAEYGLYERPVRVEAGGLTFEQHNALPWMAVVIREDDGEFRVAPDLAKFEEKWRRVPEELPPAGTCWGAYDDVLERAVGRLVNEALATLGAAVGIPDEVVALFRRRLLFDDDPGFATPEDAQAAIDALAGVSDVSRGPAPVTDEEVAASEKRLRDFLNSPPNLGPLLGKMNDGSMSDGEFLRWAGTNGERWARAFLDRYNVLGVQTPSVFDVVRAWFANAIEAGRTAGYEQANEKDAEPVEPANLCAAPDYEWLYQREQERVANLRRVMHAVVESL